MPEDLVVRLRIVPQRKQRYDTEGDWLWTAANALEVRISREVGEDDPRYGMLMFMHELIEALLCRSAGVTGACVDAFDFAYQGSGEPGDQPLAPYHRQHVAAQAAERALAEALGVNWGKYLKRGDFQVRAKNFVKEAGRNDTKRNNPHADALGKTGWTRERRERQSARMRNGLAQTLGRRGAEVRWHRADSAQPNDGAPVTDGAVIPSR
jgi:hypothetical protein